MVGVARQQQHRFEGAAHLRHRLVLSLLSNSAIRIENIRPTDTQPGLCPSEISFIRLLDKLTSGTSVHINDTGTTLIFRPGYLTGTQSVLEHQCHPSRGLSYYAEPLLLLAPFFKNPLRVLLHGVTNCITDVSADFLAAVTVPLLRRLTQPHTLQPSVTVRRRALSPWQTDEGVVQPDTRKGTLALNCELLTSKLAPIDLTDVGYVKRIRGVACANGTSPALLNRVVDAARMVLNRFSPDVYIHTDHSNEKQCGTGFALQLVAETTEGCLVGADWASSSTHSTPEHIARSAVNLLLQEVHHGGCVDSASAHIALLYCALADSDVSRVRLGKLSEANVQFLRDLRTFFGVVFKIKVVEVEEDSESGSNSDNNSDSGQEDPDEKGQHSKPDDERQSLHSGNMSTPRSIVLSCVGIGLANIARQRF